MCEADNSIIVTWTFPLYDEDTDSENKYCEGERQVGGDNQGCTVVMGCDEGESIASGRSRRSHNNVIDDA